MWISVKAVPVPTVNGQDVMVSLRYVPFYGRTTWLDSEVVTAVWDEFQHCFVEKSSGAEIYNGDISHWWCE